MLVRLVTVRSEPSGFDRARLVLQRPLGRALHVEVERRVNLESLLVQLLAELRVELLAHPFDEIGCRLAGDRFVGELQRVRFRPAGVRVADASILAHQLDDGIAALDRALGEANGVVAGGRLRKRRESRGFSKVQIADGFPKVSLRCSLDAVRAVAEVDLIEVELENSLLVVLRLDLACDFRFLDLADDGFLARDLLGEDVARELHRYGGKPLRVSVERRAQNHAGGAVPVDAGVLVEPLVFGADERFLNDLRDLVDLHQRAALETKLGDESPVSRVELRRLVRRVLGQALDRWALVSATDEGPRTVDRPHAERDEESERKQYHPDERRVPLVESEFVVGVGGHAE